MRYVRRAAHTALIRLYEWQKTNLHYTTWC